MVKIIHKPKAVQDMHGLTFNQLTGEEYVGHSVWRWRCTCGNERLAPTYDVTHNRIKSCRNCSGMANRRSTNSQGAIAPGTRFGSVVVQEYLGFNVYRVKCDCGEEQTMLASSLYYSGDRTTCEICRTMARYAQANEQQKSKNG